MEAFGPKFKKDKEMNFNEVEACPRPGIHYPLAQRMEKFRTLPSLDQSFKSDQTVPVLINKVNVASSSMRVNKIWIDKSLAEHDDGDDNQETMTIQISLQKMYKQNSRNTNAKLISNEEDQGQDQVVQEYLPRSNVNYNNKIDGSKNQRKVPTQAADFGHCSCACAGVLLKRETEFNQAAAESLKLVFELQKKVASQEACIRQLEIQNKIMSHYMEKAKAAEEFKEKAIGAKGNAAVKERGVRNQKNNQEVKLQTNKLCDFDTALVPNVSEVPASITSVRAPATASGASLNKTFTLVPEKENVQKEQKTQNGKLNKTFTVTGTETRGITVNVKNSKKTAVVPFSVSSTFGNFIR